MHIARWGFGGLLVVLFACSSESGSDSANTEAGSGGAAASGAGGKAGGAGGQGGSAQAGSGGSAAGQAGSAQAGSAQAGSAGSGQGGGAGQQAGGSDAGGSAQAGSGGSMEAGSGGSAQAGSGGSAQAGSGGSAQAGSGGSSQAGSGGSAQAGAGGSSQAGSGGSAQAGGGGSAQAGSGGSAQGGAAGNCQVLLSVPGLAHVSTVELPKKAFPIKESAPTSWHRFEVELDVKLTAWTDKQGQYEVFTLLRGDKWVGNAIGYVAFIGPKTRQSVMVTNINLPYAADKDGRRIAKSYGYQEKTTYHVRYVYDLPQDQRRLGVSVDGSEVTFVEGKMSNLPANPPFTAVDVPAKGFIMLVGGEEVADGPDAITLGWEFHDLKVTGCP